jgi:hypothetical protein
MYKLLVIISFSIFLILAHPAIAKELPVHYPQQVFLLHSEFEKNGIDAIARIKKQAEIEKNVSFSECISLYE